VPEAGIPNVQIYTTNKPTTLLVGEFVASSDLKTFVARSGVLSAKKLRAQIFKMVKELAKDSDGAFIKARSDSAKTDEDWNELELPSLKKSAKMMADVAPEQGTPANTKKGEIAEGSSANTEPNLSDKGKRDAWEGSTGELYDVCVDYLNGENGVEVDVVEAAKWCKKSAEQEQVEGSDDIVARSAAQYELAVFYFEGLLEGGEYDIAEGMKWLKKSLEVENPQAQYTLGLALLGGLLGTQKDVPRGLELLKQSAAQGESDAQTALTDHWNGILNQGSPDNRGQPQEQPAALRVEKGGDGSAEEEARQREEDLDEL
jgi:hypothetical protein